LKVYSEQSFLVLTLGCKLNQLESEAVTDAFKHAGFEQFTDNNADSTPVVIINTCTVTSKADQKARRVIRKALRDYPDSYVFVTGCYAQLNKDDILKLNTDNRQRLFVINKDSILNLPNYLNESGIPVSQFSISDFSALDFQSSAFSFNPQQFSSHTRSFLKIQDGCDKHCTYCRIRLARGQSISLDADEVLSRLRILEQSHSEAVLTGVNICQYKFFTTNHTNRTNDGGLAELLDYLLTGTEKIALRLSSLAPDSVDENLAKVLSNKRIRSHFHLSIQSCSEKVLERMGRDYNSAAVEKAVTLLRSVKEDPFLACDIITGFPGETEAEFEETYSLCKKLDFAWIHVFPYSPRQGTEAFSFKDKVHENDVTKRVQLFTDLAAQGKAGYVQRWIGREVDVLIEGKEQSNLRFGGTSENYLKVLVRCDGGKAPLPGDVVRCRLAESGFGVGDCDVGGVLI